MTADRCLSVTYGALTNKASFSSKVALQNQTIEEAIYKCENTQLIYRTRSLSGHPAGSGWRFQGDLLFELPMLLCDSVNGDGGSNRVCLPTCTVLLAAVLDFENFFFHGARSFRLPRFAPIAAAGMLPVLFDCHRDLYKSSRIHLSNAPWRKSSRTSRP